jgi:hypothetical protein
MSFDPVEICAVLTEDGRLDDIIASKTAANRPKDQRSLRDQLD